MVSTLYVLILSEFKNSNNNFIKTKSLGCVESILDPQFHLKMPRSSNRSKQAEVLKEEVEDDDKDEDFSSD